MCCIYYSRTKGEGCGHLKSIKAPPFPPSSSPPHPQLPPISQYLFFTERSKVVLMLWFTISVIVCLHVCAGENFYFGYLLANFGERSCPFGFLLVMFCLWCFKCVLFPFGVLNGGNCIDSSSVPSFLFSEIISVHLAIHMPVLLLVHSAVRTA